jgi:hypothetical protein
MTAKSILAHVTPLTHIGAGPGASNPERTPVQCAGGVVRAAPGLDTPGMHGRNVYVIGPNVPRGPLGLSFVHVIR